MDQATLKFLLDAGVGFVSLVVLYRVVNGQNSSTTQSFDLMKQMMGMNATAMEENKTFKDMLKEQFQLTRQSIEAAKTASEKQTEEITNSGQSVLAEITQAERRVLATIAPMVLKVETSQDTLSQLANGLIEMGLTLKRIQSGIITIENYVKVGANVENKAIDDHSLGADSFVSSNGPGGIASVAHVGRSDSDGGSNAGSDTVSAATD